MPSQHRYAGDPGALGPSLGREPKVRCCPPGQREGLAAFQVEVPSYSNHPPTPTVR